MIFLVVQNVFLLAYIKGPNPASLKLDHYFLHVFTFQQTGCSDPVV